VQTGVLSDLHLGTRTRDDLLRRPEVRAGLIPHLRGLDQLVLLGDAIEFRDRTCAEALRAATPFLEDVGAALAGRRVVIVPGNHDHRVLREALASDRGARARLREGLEIRAGHRGLLAAIRARLGTELLLAYPGFEPAPGTWVTHGHYLDAHSAAPTLECVATAVLGAARRRSPARATSPEDYEAVLAPTYALFDGIAQRPRLNRLADAGKLAVRAVERRLGMRGPVKGRTGGRPPLAARVLLHAPDRAATSPGEVRRPGLRPMELVLEHLGVQAETVVFGHTHRTGPLPGDDVRQWRTRGGARLVNTGSWIYEPAYVGDLGSESPYWPGTLTLLSSGRPPAQLRILEAWHLDFRPVLRG
jgi:UDP-2,3-diacylglucosamine pyrophosphatase LpxH